MTAAQSWRIGEIRNELAAWKGHRSPTYRAAADPFTVEQIRDAASRLDRMTFDDDAEQAGAVIGAWHKGGLPAVMGIFVK